VKLLNAIYKQKPKDYFSLLRLALEIYDDWQYAVREYFGKTICMYSPSFESDLKILKKYGVIRFNGEGRIAGINVPEEIRDWKLEDNRLVLFGISGRAYVFKLCTCIHNFGGVMELLDKLEKAIEVVLAEQDMRKQHYEEKLKVIREIRERLRSKGKLDWEDVRLVMQLTCFGNIAYCCKARVREDDKEGKDCPWRDAVLEILGISKEEFNRVKEQLVNNWLHTRLDIQEGKKITL